ncbi:hypothetical protein DFJ74DRAFT_385907 [Hyaloraphidium curvatum]|nr:hypothetical protein DFJ74DRAFT_385907 [Hyaloraphidium curvatum]
MRIPSARRAVSHRLNGILRRRWSRTFSRGDSGPPFFRGRGSLTARAARNLREMARAARIAALWTLAVSLLAHCGAGAEAQVAANGSGGVAWFRAQTCCAGCSYSNKLNCCCPRREPLTVTRFRTATRSITASARTSQTARSGKRVAPRELPADDRVEAALRRSQEPDDADSRDAPPGHMLQARAARSLCPPCPPGAHLRTNPNPDPRKPDMPCCASRPTVTRTRTRTRTVIATRT